MPVKMMENIITVKLDGKSGERLDKYCSEFCGITRSRLKNGADGIYVNGVPAKLSKIVKPGDVISFMWEDPVPDDIKPENIPLDILFEDSNVTVVNKKQGMVTHPGAGNWNGTLVNALLFHWGKDVSSATVSLRPGIVHRLDKDTSGVIITARNPETESFLQNEFKSRHVKKIYAAVLCGLPPAKQGIVETFIMRDPKNRMRFVCTTDSSKGKYAKTAYKVIYWNPERNLSFVVFRIYTGRTHQIRVHSRFLGCPVLGDSLYGKKNKIPGENTLMLHAMYLKIKIPGKQEPVVFRATLPQRFKEILKSLKDCGKGI